MIPLFLLVLVATLPLTACVRATGTKDSYPGNWPSIDAGQRADCPDLTGQFGNRGDRSPSAEDYRADLADHLGIRLTALQSVDTEQVRISMTMPDVIEVTAQSSTLDRLGSKRLSMAAGDYTCADGFLVLPSTSDAEWTELGPMNDSQGLSLSRAADGSLIGKERTSTAALAMYVVPVYDVHINWYRWVER